MRLARFYHVFGNPKKKFSSYVDPKPEIDYRLGFRVVEQMPTIREMGIIHRQILPLKTNFGNRQSYLTDGLLTNKDIPNFIPVTNVDFPPKLIP
jgi:hypothetical protein